MKVAVLTGGTSAEREVALATGRGIVRALRANGHEVATIDTGEGRMLEGEGPWAAQGSGGVGAAGSDGRSSAAVLRAVEDGLVKSGAEVAFIALHGGAGEDGRLQALLDLMGIPYTGSGYLGSALAMDKLVSKELFSCAGIPTPPWLVTPAEARHVEVALGGFPVVVKPGREGSTVGVSVVREGGELEKAIEEAAEYGNPVLIEKYVAGRELAVGVLGDEALPAVEIRPTHEIYDYACKYTKGLTEYEVPAPLSQEEDRQARLLALRAHRILRLSAYSRIDFRMDPDGHFWCLEANSLPGMTETSLIPKAAAAVGMTFSALCEQILDLALAGSVAGTRHDGRA